MLKKKVIINQSVLFTQDAFSLIAGPCAVEDQASLQATAKLLQKHGVKIIRGGGNKLRTSPESFQGYGEKALIWLSEIAHEHNLFAMSEITSEKELDFFEKHIDIILIGTRNMHNYQLLKEVSQITKPIILKRGFAATVHEWLQAAAYLSQHGNEQIILCERGIRTFETNTRYTLDLASAVYTSQTTPYHVLTDPSHATGRADLVPPMVLASRAAGLSGAMIEIHPNPSGALSDGEQMLNFEQFERLMEKFYVITP